jgi:hypothetical protein
MKLTVEIVGLKGVEDALSQAGPKLAKRALRKALVAGRGIIRGGGEEECARPRESDSKPPGRENCATRSI